MAHSIINRKSDLNVKQDDLLASKRYVIERKPDFPLFYELEEAVVLDVILDQNHPEMKQSQANPDDWPKNIDGSQVTGNDLDYGMIGKIKFRFLYGERGQPKESLNWAYPIENTGITEWPLMNEIVIIAKYLNKYYYSKKLNFKSVVNSDASFITERVAGHAEENRNEYDPNGKYHGPTSTMNATGGTKNYQGILGSYFKFNPNIRSLKRYEGDTILESRFGSSIRFGAYDDNRGNDNGKDDYADGGGNPMVLIRNKQAPVKNPEGKTAKGYVSEDINKDGSSMHMTSGKTVSGFRPPINIPNVVKGSTAKVPTLDGDQIIINSDRLVFSSRSKETLIFSKGLIGMTTESHLSGTAKGAVTFNSLEDNIYLNAKKIYLGFNKSGASDQPVILGGELTQWLDTLTDVLMYILNSNVEMAASLATHIHVATGPLAPTTPPPPPWSVLFIDEAQSYYGTIVQLKVLQSQIAALQSTRAFVGK